MARKEELDYTAESNVVPEAKGELRKRGGRAKHAAGGAVAGFKRGGMMSEGMKGGRRMDRPGRKRGGGVGATLRPLSTAATTTQAGAHKADNDELAD